MLYFIIIHLIPLIHASFFLIHPNPSLPIATMLPMALGLKLLLAILAALAGDIGVSYNGSGRHSTELQACFYGAATTMTPTIHESVMGRLMGTNTNPSKFSDEASQQNIHLMNNVIAGLSTSSQQWLFVALTHGEGLGSFYGSFFWSAFNLQNYKAQ